MHAIVLGLHVLLGVSSLALGATVFVAAARGVAGTGRSGLFHRLVSGVCLTALGLGAFDVARLWWLAPVAAFTWSFAWRARRADRRTRRGEPVSVATYLRAQGGANIALWTALLVVSADWGLVAWVLPTAVLVPPLEWLGHRRSRTACRPTAVAH